MVTTTGRIRGMYNGSAIICGEKKWTSHETTRSDLEEGRSCNNRAVDPRRYALILASTDPADVDSTAIKESEIAREFQRLSGDRGGEYDRFGCRGLELSQEESTACCHRRRRLTTTLLTARASSL